MAKPEIVVAMPQDLFEQFFAPQEVARLQELGTVTLSPTPTNHRSPEALELLKKADVLITGWGTDTLDQELMELAPNLKGVVHSGGSVRHVVTADAYDRGIRVSSQTAQNAVPVAEYTLAMILLAAKDTFRAARRYDEKRARVDIFNEFSHAGVYRCRVGLIGLSMISRLVIDMLRPFETETVVFSRHLSEEEASRLGVKVASIEEIMQTCPVISLHSADNPANYHMINRELLRMIPAGATFINTARGRLVDQDALIEELRDGRFNAILDVADPDVTVPDSPLWDMPNVILTPHFAGSMGRELFRLGNGAVHDVENLLAGQPMGGEILRDEYERRA